MIKTLDLQECLARWITKATGIKIKVDFLSPDTAVGLVPDPGSHVVDAEMDGTQHWQYNYAITMQSNDAGQVKNTLFAIQNALSTLTSLQSKNKSFVFERVDVSSAPAMTLKDIKGTTVYSLDFAVFVYTN